MGWATVTTAKAGDAHARRRHARPVLARIRARNPVGEGREHASAGPCYGEGRGGPLATDPRRRDFESVSIRSSGDVRRSVALAPAGRWERSARIL